MRKINKVMLSTWLVSGVFFLLLHSRLFAERVIIQFSGKADARLIQKVKGEVLLSVSESVISAEIPSAAVWSLRANPSIVTVEQDGILHASGINSTDPEVPWGVDRIDADESWPTTQGAYVDASGTVVPTKVAIIDTGIELTHPDLSANIKGNVTFVSKTTSGNDDNGHGTHVAGIVAAIKNGVGVVGVAPQAALYAVKVLDKTGSGYTSWVAAGINWAAQNGMQVANMSLGSTQDSTTLHNAVTAAYNAGVLLVAAAGNDGKCPMNKTSNNVEYPAKYPEVIAVSATTKTDTVACFSSTGPQIALSAPGYQIYSTYIGGTYATLSGTSMAAPHVSGTAALVYSLRPTDTNGDGRVNDEVRSILQSTADDFGPVGWDPQYGYGIVDAYRAIGSTH